MQDSLVTPLALLSLHVCVAEGDRLSHSLSLLSTPQEVSRSHAQLSACGAPPANGLEPSCCSSEFHWSVSQGDVICEESSRAHSSQPHLRLLRTTSSLLESLFNPKLHLYFYLPAPEPTLHIRNGGGEGFFSSVPHGFRAMVGIPA